MKVQTLLLVTTLTFSPAAFGAITISPASPTTGDTITIRVENSFGAEARATSANITQTGNSFVIQQNVEIACMLPSAPIVASDFQVGPLAPGMYSVTANITFTGIGPMPCSPAPVTQNTAFSVAPSANVPTISPILLVFLGIVLAGVALAVIRG